MKVPPERVISMLHRSSTYAELLHDLQQFKAVERLLGCDLKKTRLGAYERQIKRLVEIMDPDRPFNLTREEVHNAILAFPEILDLRFALNAVLANPRLAKRDRFREIFHGPSLTKDESNKQPRDTLFEFTIAALIEYAGLKTDPNPICDVETDFLGVRMCIECKRPHGEAKLAEHIKKAAEQLDARLMKGGQSAAGFIAISYTHIVTDGFKRIVADDEESLQFGIGNEGNNFIQRIGPLWTQYPWVTGVIAQLCVGGTYGRQVTSVMNFTPTMRPDLDPKTSAFVLAFYGKLKDGLKNSMSPPRNDPMV